ncbi:hypothetical protein VU06_04860, partial [Desulfobulbus sp. F3]|nr:hypothetical protein [Desulfobulbus sp. F3]
ELLRLGLMHGREILTQAGLDSLLRLPPLNPMNAIFAAHLAVRQENAEFLARLAKQINSSLAGLPDLRSVLPGSVPFFDQPPMLRSSWQRILDAVSKEKASIPLGSTVAQLQDGLMNTELWAMRRVR